MHGDDPVCGGEPREYWPPAALTSEVEVNGGFLFAFRGRPAQVLVGPESEQIVEQRPIGPGERDPAAAAAGSSTIASSTPGNRVQMPVSR
ncbi:MULTISPECIES: hypothetical protein [Amycolatopsis]|uniref:Uncharacterized protein n=1 Tax=Amycolatopsis albidoflavus TaxID=102226 RepID=A0ABW5I3F2_9PSEU